MTTATTAIRTFNDAQTQLAEDIMASRGFPRSYRDEVGHHAQGGTSTLTPG
jgi:hypothetical protein